MSEPILQTLMGAIGSLGFAILFNVRGQRLFFAFLGGGIGWGVCCLAGLWWPDNEALCYFIATTALALYAECMARLLRCPSTVMLVTGWIPLIPGGALYNSIAALVAKQMDDFVERTLHTIFLMIAMSAGILLAMTIVHILSPRARSRNNGNKKAIAESPAAFTETK